MDGCLDELISNVHGWVKVMEEGMSGYKEETGYMGYME